MNHTYECMDKIPKHKLNNGLNTWIMEDLNVHNKHIKKRYTHR